MRWVTRRSDRSIWRWVQCISPGVPDSNGAVGGSGVDVLPIGRGIHGLHRVRVRIERISDWSTSLGIPDSNSAVSGSGDDVLPIGRVFNRPHRVHVPLERITNWSTSPGIPDSN